MGFLIGLVGSLHCVGMCGPLVATVIKNAGYKALITYHFGRLVVYVLVGVVFGMLSTSLIFFQLQQNASIVLGLVIVAIYCFPKYRNKIEGRYYRSRFYQSVKTQLTGHYSGPLKWLAAGIMNGLLPCGMIYLAAAGASLSPGLIHGVGFMVMFGLGTLPGLLGFMLAAKQLKRLLPNMSGLSTSVALISGIILIGRGIMTQMPEFDQLVQTHLMSAISACGF
ncbi:MAG: sulfite exporter TauE/SafE family protein [Marinoscillum sp.]